jgi:hypothetical protein
MNITSAKYIENEFKLGTNIQIKATINGTEMLVPLDPANTDYQAILEWAKIDGNTIEEAD